VEAHWGRTGTAVEHMDLAGGTGVLEQSLDIDLEETEVGNRRAVVAAAVEEADWGLDMGPAGRVGIHLELVDRTSLAGRIEEVEELRNRLVAGKATAAAEDIAAGRTEELEEDSQRRLDPSNPVAEGSRLAGDTGCCTGHS